MLKINDLLNKLEAELKRIIVERQLIDPLMIGIRTGGIWIAEQMHKRLNINEPLGLLDISFYRDDFTRKGLQPVVKPSSLPTE